MTFFERLARAQRDAQTALCVGLDPDLARLPEHLLRSRSPAAAVEHFCRTIIEATADVACAFKLNAAFFEQLGDHGTAVMRRIRQTIPEGIVTVADAKRGDIGNSARFYADAMLEDLGFDSITVNPYMGRDSVVPFLGSSGKAAFVLVRTSNEGRHDFQDRLVDGLPLFELVAHRSAEFAHDTPGEVGFVVGASDIPAMSRLRLQHPRVPFLVPGVGAQGGSPESVMDASGHEAGLTLVNSSRAICFASPGDDFGAAARKAASQAAQRLHVDPEAKHG